MQEIDTRTRNKRGNRNEKHRKHHNTRTTTPETQQRHESNSLEILKIKKIDQSEETLFETDFVTYYVAFKVKTTRFRSGRCLYMLYDPVMLCRRVYLSVESIHVVFM